MTGSGPTRRRLLGWLGVAGLAGLAVGPAGCGSDAAPGRDDRVRRDVDDHGEWWVPAGATGPTRTVVLVHGGFWRDGYDRHLEDPLAADLAGHGWLVWNVDYRPASTAWPTTLEDAATAYDALTTGAHADLVDRGRVAAVGHSAGGHLALWLASRRRIPADSVGAVPDDWVRPALAVGQAPVAALVAAAEAGVGGDAVPALCDGTPTEVPDRYAVADPVALLPTGIRTVCIHADDDDTVPIEQSQRYVDAAREAGDDARLVTVHGGHYVHLDPDSTATAKLYDALAHV